MKTTVIFHRADFDGIFCREIARKFLPEAELIGWDYGDAKLAFPSEGMVYVLDLNPECFAFPGYSRERLIWIDHHKSAIDTLPSDLSGYRIDGVAACRLAWQWFSTNGTLSQGIPLKQAFVDRCVSEPLAVRLAGEYDIWDKRDPRAELFQHGLRSRDLTDWWPHLLGEEVVKKMTVDELERSITAGVSVNLRPDGLVSVPGLAERMVENLLKRGEAIQYAQTRQNESVIKEIGFTFQWEGLTFLGCNSARYNSHLFTAGLNPEHDGCFGFKWTGKEWTVSLYGVPGKPDIDFSAIAKKYGGGGHKQACGFRTPTLPFLDYELC